MTNKGNGWPKANMKENVTFTSHDGMKTLDQAKKVQNLAAWPLGSGEELVKGPASIRKTTT